jgi:AmmeMemoRadiSam system protein B
MSKTRPVIRTDLEFLPVQKDGQAIILIRDPLGLVKEGQAVKSHFYEFMTLLDGTHSLRDLQMELMRRQGGILVGQDEVERILSNLDADYMLDSVRFQAARRQIVETFCAEQVRACSHCGRSYPKDPAELHNWLDQILETSSSDVAVPSNVIALVAPHIDPAAGAGVYATAYRMLRHTKPSRVVIMGTGHQLRDGLFCLTKKDFDTPLGIILNDSQLTGQLQQAGGSMIAADDFAHKTEHAIEFQLIILQHLFAGNPFTVVPILCGSFLTGLSDYSRKAFLKRAGSFLKIFKALMQDPGSHTLFVAGVDFSHVGPKFGHSYAADYLEGQAKAHDQALLKYLCDLDCEGFWQESVRVEDRYNVCGFSTLATLLDILPSCRGQILEYRLQHEPATQSAVGIAAAMFTAADQT